MSLIGYALCASFCTLSRSLAQMRALVEAGYTLQPIMSEHAYSLDTRFFRAEELRGEVERITGRPILHTLTEAEPLGPALPLDALVIAPCTGNTLSRIANGMADTAVSMAVKAHLRCDRPTLIALASNDALSQNLHSIATLLARKQVYLVPMQQDDPEKKPHSLVARFDLLPQALHAMLEQEGTARQLRPLFLS